MDSISKLKCYDYIIIGGGIAGVSCLEQLTTYDETCLILLITASDFVKNISNVQSITKTLDSFDVEEISSTVLENKFPSVSVIKSAVTDLDVQNQVVFANELSFRYRKLCLCSGATPKLVLPEHPLILWIRDTESVIKFQQRLSTSKRVMVVGNGGIATEMVYEITGIEIIWAIKDKSLNATFIDAGAAEFLRPKLSEDKESTGEKITKRHKYTIDKSVANKTYSNKLGGALGPDWHSGLELSNDPERHVTIETEVHVSEIFSPHDFRESKYWNKREELDWPVYVVLSNGKYYGCDCIISATGVVPNVEVFRRGASFALGEDGGLLVNENMETSVPNVYAAGDACTAGWDIAHHWFQLRLWTQARQMGSYAARCMWAGLNEEKIYMDFCFELFSHVTKFFGKNVILLGLFNGQKLHGKYEILLRMTKGQEYIKCVMVDGRMQGAILIGDTGLEETFENLIINQIDLSEYGEDLLNPSVDIEDYFD